MAAFSAITTWFTTKFFLGKKISRLVEDNSRLGEKISTLVEDNDSRMDEIKSRHTVDDLRIIEEYANWWTENQRPDGKIDFLEKGIRDVDRLFAIQTLLEKYSDWFSTEPEGIPEAERMEHIRSEVVESIDLITKHGYKKALKIRQKLSQIP